jgi:ADP-ribose pyrophosphatase YjhB (NUDIX family)
MKGWLGRVLFQLNLPIIRRILNGSTRVRVVVTDNDEQNVLLIKNLLSQQKWSLPGGGVKSGESFEAAASRELKEELGLNLPPQAFEPLDSFNHLEAETKADWQAVILKCAIPRSTNFTKRRYELLKHGWFALDKLPGDITGLTLSVLNRHNP